MKLSVVALDYDGTIAQHDVLNRDVRKAIAELRIRGIVVVLVTGRILDELRRVAGDLRFVDAVVAENGGVIEFPDSGYLTVIGQPPPQTLIEALRRERIPFAAGRSIIDADANEASRILGLIRRLELPVVPVFNRGRVMLLSQGISKATGLQQALTILRLSPHNAIGIGDAENDHELLRTCEVGVAVAWGSETLKAAADYVLPGEDPSAVARYLRPLGQQARIPAPTRTRRQLLLGHADDGEPLALAVRGRNVLIAGDPKSGKSWVAGLLCEQLILHGYSLCIIDPEGDYTSLEALPGAVVFGGADPLPRPRDLLRALRHPDVSIVIDLSHAPHEEKLDYVRTLLPGLAVLRRRTGHPHRIIVDEAHYFLHRAGDHTLLDNELNGYTLVTHRASRLHRDVLAGTQAIVVTRESDPAEVRALFALCGTCRNRKPEAEWHRLLEGLVIGEAVALPITQESEGEVRRIHLAPRLTPHVRHASKYIDIPISHARAFVFWENGAPSGPRARTLREFVEILERTTTAALSGHVRRHDFSRWLADVFGDFPMSKAVRQVEDEYLAGTPAQVPLRISEVVRARYEFLTE